MEILKPLDARRLSCYRAGIVEDGLVRELEDLFCENLNIRYAVAMNSATSCLHVACSYAGRDFVTTPVTFSSSASCAFMAGGDLSFSDIDDYYCNDPETSKAENIILVHLHGQPADIDRFEGFIIEDCSQAIGAKYHGRYVGTIGNCGVFSFNRWKQVQSGEGGMLVTNDENLFNFARLMSNHGEVISSVLGYNYRMTEMQAAILIPQIEHIDQILSERIEKAEYLSYKLGDSAPRVRDGCKHTFYSYPVWVDKRDEIQEALLKEGFYFGKGGYKPLYKMPFYENIEHNCPKAEAAYEHVMYTNGYHKWSFRDIDRIAEVICG